MAVEVEFSLMRKKDIQVSRLQRDGFLLVKGDPEVWIQSNPADLLSVRFLEFYKVEKIGDSIGQLSHLTHLSIRGRNLKCLPNSISSLPYLQRLELLGCRDLQELPANLGDLNSLTFLSLDNCHSIKSLPNSISKLSNLTSLHLLFCESLKELPAISNVVELKLFGSNNIQSLPKGLCNLKKLHLFRCRSLAEWPTDLNLLQIKIEYCCSIESLPKILTNLQQLHLPRCSKILSHANLIYFRSLRQLTFDNRCSCEARLKELPANLGEQLSQLSTLNIQYTDIKWLPWSITKLSKLRLLSLPEHFRLETLPNHLKDSIVVSVEDRHIRKTWQQLKTEIQLFSIPIVGLKETHSPSTPGYLQYRADGGFFIWAFNTMIKIDNLYSLVRILDLDLQDLQFDRRAINSIGELQELTHLYISHGKLHNLPLPITRLAQLSLSWCNFQFCCDSLGKLSTLQSLTLRYCTNLPADMDLPVSLTHFALESRKFDSLPDIYMASMRKLSNLKSLELFGYESLELSLLDLNLTKLKITHCSIKSLPRCLRHLEIIHSIGSCFRLRGCWDQLQLCLSEVVDLETLSVTCYDIKVLPSIARHQTLQELQLKDCFNLRKLPPDLDELVELCTLNVSGTRIKSLPNSITKLKNLQYLILPKYFKLESLPKNFEHKVSVSVDVTDDVYYEHAGYNESCYDSSEVNEITSEVMEGGEEVVFQVSTHDSIIDQASSQSLLKPQPDATQVHEVPTGSQFSRRTVPIDNVFSSSHNLEMEILPTVNEECGVPLVPNSDYHEMDGHHFVSNMRQVHADPKELEDSPLNGLTDAVGESSSLALCNLQIEETEILTIRNRDCMRTLANDSAAKLISNLYEINFFSERNQHGFQNGRMNTFMEIEQGSEEPDATNSVCGGYDDLDLDIGQNHNPRSDNVKDYNPLDCILPLMSQNMRLVDAAKQLDVSSSTSKRILKTNEIEWPSSRKRKQPQDANSRKQRNTESRLVGKDSSLLNLVDPAIAGHDLVGEKLDILDQLTLSDWLWVVPSEVNAAHESICAVSRRVAQDPSVEPPSTVGAPQFVKERSSVAEGGVSLDSVQQPTSSSTFIVKASYNEDIIKFDLPLNSSIEQLKKELSNRLELDIGKIKMKYQDEENDWILIKLTSDLEHALRFSNSSGRSALKLSITTSES